MMKPINGPFLEYGFYSHTTEDRVLFTDLIQILLSMGAHLVGDGYVFQIKDDESGLFTDRHLRNLQRIPMTTASDLETYLTDPNLRVVSVEMSGASDTTRDVAECITYLRTSAAASNYRRNPVALQTNGEYFCNFDAEPLVATKRFVQRANTLGLRAYARFIAIVKQIMPSYATLSVERSLKCPMDLKETGDAYLFHDFYVSTAFVGERSMDKLRKKYSSAYIEAINDGYYFSCTRILNPSRTQKETTIQYDNSLMVSEIIAASEI